jgi:hypothetical protein
LAKYLEKELGDDMQMRDLIEYSSFGNMRNVKSLDLFEHFRSSALLKKDSKFFATGKVGNWRAYFSDELSDKFDEIIRRNLKYKGHIDYDA